MSAFREADRLLRAGFGEPTEGRGRYFFAKKRRYEGGAELLYESVQGRDECVVDLSGAVLGAMEQWESWQLVQALDRAGLRRVTRLDLAVDFRADRVELVEAVREACEGGELTGAKRYEVMGQYSGGRLQNAMVRLGSRGNTGSGRFGRCYDKGLETKTESANKWHRLEVEFTGELAGIAWYMLLRSEPEKGRPWTEQARLMVLGAFDFREVTGSRELKRRPRAGWWSRVVGASEGVRLKAKKRAAAALARTAAWVKKCVAPTLVSMMRRTRRDLAQVFQDLVGDVEEVRSVLRASVFEYESCHAMAPPGGVSS